MHEIKRIVELAVQISNLANEITSSVDRLETRPAGAAPPDPTVHPPAPDRQEAGSGAPAPWVRIVSHEQGMFDYIQRVHLDRMGWFSLKNGDAHFLRNTPDAALLSWTGQYEDGKKRIPTLTGISIKNAAGYVVEGGAS